MKQIPIIALCLFAALASSTTVGAYPRAFTRHTMTISFGQKKIQLEAPRDMCFLDATDAGQGNVITQMRLNSWKGRKHVVMALFADCKEVANMPLSKELVPLTAIGVVRWLNPDIGERSDLPLDDYLTIREVSFRSDIANDLTQFKKIELEKDVKRLDHSVAIGYVGRSEIESQRYNTIGVDATTLIQSVPLDISITKTASTMDKKKTDTKPLLDLMTSFIDQQIFLNKNK